MLIARPTIAVPAPTLRVDCGPFTVFVTVIVFPVPDVVFHRDIASLVAPLFTTVSLESEFSEFLLDDRVDDKGKVLALDSVTTRLVTTLVEARVADLSPPPGP